MWSIVGIFEDARLANLKVCIHIEVGGDLSSDDEDVISRMLVDRQ
jgi:hypothetical protein